MAQCLSLYFHTKFFHKIGTRTLSYCAVHVFECNMPPPFRPTAPASLILFVPNKAARRFFSRGDEQPMCFTDGKRIVEVNDSSKVIDQVNHIWLGPGSIMTVCPVSSLAGLSLPVLGRIPNWVIWCMPAGPKLPLWFCTHLVIFHFSLWHVL